MDVMAALVTVGDWAVGDWDIDVLKTVLTLAGAAAAAAAGYFKGPPALKLFIAAGAALVVVVFALVVVKPIDTDDETSATAKPDPTPQYVRGVVKTCADVRAAQIKENTPGPNSDPAKLGELVAARTDYESAKNQFEQLEIPPKYAVSDANTRTAWEEHVRLFDRFADKAKAAPTTQRLHDLYEQYDREQDSRLRRKVVAGLQTAGGDDCQLD